jgi:hypothetical protein
VDGELLLLTASYNGAGNDANVLKFGDPTKPLTTPVGEGTAFIGQPLRASVFQVATNACMSYDYHCRI